MATTPAEDQEHEEAAKHLIVSPFYKDGATGATFVHRDLVEVEKAYAHEEHIGPVKVDEKFGDVESFAAYLKGFATEGAFVTWSARGLQAVLDYPDRRQWLASHPFVMTPEFAAWNAVANGQAVDHKKAVEFLDDHAPDIYEPSATDLLALLRTLRANANATVDMNMRGDGTADLKFAKSTSVAGPNEAALPPEITIAIPVLRGHLDDDGQLVRYKLVLKLRASVGADAHLALRFTMPAADRVLEEVYAERVAKARELLADDFRVLRAAN